MFVKRISSISGFAVAAALSSSAWGQTASDNLLATVNVNGLQTCAQIEIKLNRPINITDTVPAEKAMDIALHIEPLATELPTTTSASLKEAATVPPQNVAGLGGVIYDPTATTGPVIHIVFAKEMAYKLRRDDDKRHIMIAASSVEDALTCIGFKPTIQATTSNGTDKTDASATPAAPTPGSEAAAALSDGKKQLAAGDFNRATAYFTKAISLGTGRIKQDAQEMIGLARERAGQMAFAKSEYDTYLRLYPTGPDAARVKDRLQGIVAAMEVSANKQFELHQSKTAANQPQSNTAAKGNVAGTAPNQLAATTPGANTVLSAQGMRSNIQEPVKDPKAWTWDKSGSVSQNYYRGDSFLPSVLYSSSLDHHSVSQNEVLSNFDGFIHGENDAYSVEARTSLYDEKGLGDQSNTHNYALSSAYIDGKLKGPKIGLRLGRQSKSTGGVFGRFDGGVATYEGLTNFKLQSVLGSPVYNSSKVFADSRYFYGTSLEYTSTDKMWGGSIYAIQQNIADIVDRRAIGGDARYTGKKGSIYGAADYDVFYGELNNAYVSGNWLPFDGTTVYSTIDYRKIPFLLTSNSLLGQNYSTLTDLKGAIGIDALNQCAADRTASSESVTAGVSRQFNEKWQASIDASVSNYTGTPASLACNFGDPGITFTPDPGLDFYGSVQLTGISLLKENDSLSVGLRYATSQTNNTYMADGSFRYPINEKLRFGPRMFVSLNDSKIMDQKTWTLSPRMKLDYRLNKSWSFESELGASWRDVVTPAGSSLSLDISAEAGYRFDF